MIDTIETCKCKIDGKTYDPNDITCKKCKVAGQALEEIMKFAFKKFEEGDTDLLETVIKTMVEK